MIYQASQYISRSAAVVFTDDTTTDTHCQYVETATNERTQLRPKWRLLSFGLWSFFLKHLILFHLLFFFSLLMTSNHHRLAIAQPLPPALSIPHPTSSKSLWASVANRFCSQTVTNGGCSLAVVHLIHQSDWCLGGFFQKGFTFLIL